jgi:hypothetical protein
MARTHRCAGWLGTVPRIAVSCQAMAPHNRPVSPSAITDNPGSVSIATGSGFSAVSPGLTQQCLDREVDPAAASGTRIAPPTRRILPPGAPFVPNVSSAGNHQGMHHLRVDAVSNKPGRRTSNSPQLLLLLLLLLNN